MVKLTPQYKERIGTLLVFIQSKYTELQSVCPQELKGVKELMGATKVQLDQWNELERVMRAEFPDVNGEDLYKGYRKMRDNSTYNGVPQWLISEYGPFPFLNHLREKWIRKKKKLNRRGGRVRRTVKKQKKPKIARKPAPIRKTRRTPSAPPDSVICSEEALSPTSRLSMESVEFGVLDDEMLNYEVPEDYQLIAGQTGGQIILVDQAPRSPAPSVLVIENFAAEDKAVTTGFWATDLKKEREFLLQTATLPAEPISAFQEREDFDPNEPGPSSNCPESSKTSKWRKLTDSVELSRTKTLQRMMVKEEPSITEGDENLPVPCIESSLNDVLSTSYPRFLQRRPHTPKEPMLDRDPMHTSHITEIQNQSRIMEEAEIEPLLRSPEVSEAAVFDCIKIEPEVMEEDKIQDSLPDAQPVLTPTNTTNSPEPLRMPEVSKAAVSKCIKMEPKITEPSASVIRDPENDPKKLFATPEPKPSQENGPEDIADVSEASQQSPKALKDHKSPIDGAENTTAQKSQKSPRASEERSHLLEGSVENVFEGPHKVPEAFEPNALTEEELMLKVNRLKQLKSPSIPEEAQDIFESSEASEAHTAKVLEVVMSNVESQVAENFIDVLLQNQSSNEPQEEPTSKLTTTEGPRLEPARTPREISKENEVPEEPSESPVLNLTTAPEHPEESTTSAKRQTVASEDPAVLESRSSSELSKENATSELKTAQVSERRVREDDRTPRVPSLFIKIQRTKRKTESPACLEPMNKRPCLQRQVLKEEIPEILLKTPPATFHNQTPSTSALPQVIPRSPNESNSSTSSSSTSSQPSPSTHSISTYRERKKLTKLLERENKAKSEANRLEEKAFELEEKKRAAEAKAQAEAHAREKELLDRNFAIK
ncbi:hypothetical protein L596_019634 [Steinernema carpocapsae]|uniref:Uncharacterized protein n=1 Tax=Steinernema carpocapsae TaxID=34508 RepID=A0A4U5MR38_STECR|nr:hypothetical protein L596_019634 [Steinernema carpocapsae]